MGAGLLVTRLAIDHLRSARVRRETFVGQRMPEPLLTGPSDDPGADGVVQAVRSVINPGMR